MTIRCKQRLLIAVISCLVWGHRGAAQQTLAAPKQTGNQHASTVRVVSIRFVLGGGFGCVCYCGSEIQVSAGAVTLLERPVRDCQQRDPQKYREFRVDADLSRKHWQELQQLVDHDSLFSLPDTIWCPGCTGDEGSELIEVKFSDRTKKSVYCTGGVPKEIGTLSEKLFALVAKMERELPPGWRRE